MPGNKRPNRKPGKKKSRTPASDTTSVNQENRNKHVTKTFGPKPSRSPISPTMNRGSARGR